MTAEDPCRKHSDATLLRDLTKAQLVEAFQLTFIVFDIVAELHAAVQAR